MIADLYPDMLDLGIDLIGTFGRPIIVHHASGLGSDLVEGTRTGTRTKTTEQGVVCNNQGKLMSDVRMVGNASIMTSDVKVLFPGTVTIDDDDKLEFDGYVWAVLKGHPINPGGVNVLTSVTVRR